MPPHTAYARVIRKTGSNFETATATSILPHFESLDASIAQLASELSATRRHLHQYPELSGSEIETTAYLSRLLTAAGIGHRLGPRQRGIITAIAPASPPRGPVIAMRADIDALPIREENDVPYRSRNDGIMHACGHDAHSAIVLGATLALHRAGPLRVAWRSIFQPSEEAGNGAREMVDAGALKGVDAIIALHVDPTLKAGFVGITPGPQTASCQDFQIIVRGKGGHGARPHTTKDPIASAAALITLIYQFVPRRTDARDPLVVTIGAVNAGHAANVIPDEAILKGTIRSLDPSAAKHARETLDRLCSGVARSLGGRISIAFDALLPGVINDPSATAICTAAAVELVGRNRVITTGRPSMGAEDFADYLTVVPGCMIRLGVKSPRKKPTPLHTSTFDLDENALVIGARILTRSLMRWPDRTTNSK